MSKQTGTEQKLVRMPIIYRTGGTSHTPIEEMERSVCFICATERPTMWAITECSHRVCITCSLRMRALYNNMLCTFCKSDLERVIVTRAQVGADGSDHTKPFEELFSPNLPKDESLGIYFSDESTKVEALRLTNFSCRVPKCGQATKIWSSKEDLKRHINTAHHLTFCDICLSHKKVFISELKAYTKSELIRHQKEGDNGLGGHPSCTLCGTLFYSEDELNEHCRDRHEQCHICQRQRGGKPTYHRDYTALEEHFRREHYLCEERLCLDLKFVVFENELEYKAHVAEMHLANFKMQRSAKTQLRRLDTNFSFSTSSNGRVQREQRRLTSNFDNSTTPPSTNAATTSLSTVSPVPPTPDVATLLLPLPKTTIKNLIYGEAIGELARRMQSLSMYEQRNVDFCTSLDKDYNFSESKISSLKEYCRKFQRGELSAIGLILKLEALVVEHERLKQISPIIIDLQLDSQKKQQLNEAMKAHLQRMIAFPPLSSLKESDRPSLSFGRIGGGNSSAKSSSSAPLTATNGHTVLRIKPSSQVPEGSRRNPPLDPSRNPLTLLGGSVKSTTLLSAGTSTSTAASLKKKQAPSFRQAISSSSPVGIVEEGKVRPQHFASNEAEFPPLLASPKEKAAAAATAAPTTLSGNIFAVSENRNAPESFVIGCAENAKEFESRKDKMFNELGDQPPSSSTNRAASTSKKKKGQVVMRYG